MTKDSWEWLHSSLLRLLTAQADFLLWSSVRVKTTELTLINCTTELSEREWEIKKNNFPKPAFFLGEGYSVA